jgi:hypothetical protein
MLFFFPVFAYETVPHPHRHGYKIVNCNDGRRVVINSTFRLHHKAQDKCGEIIMPQPGLSSKEALDANEALAYCWKNSASQWLCDGRIQRTPTASRHLQVQLNAVGCDIPRKQIQSQKGSLFYCGYTLDNRVSKTKNTWNRDIRLWWDLD